jgi:hypothetical protein
MKYQIVPFSRIRFQGDWQQEPLDGGVFAYYPGTGACIVEVEPIGEYQSLYPVIATWSREPGNRIGTTWIVGQVAHLPEEHKRGQR